MPPKRRQTVDENNNAIEVDKVSIRLDDDLSIVGVGDIVWLKMINHDAKHFLTTPFIIVHFKKKSEQINRNFYLKKKENEPIFS